MNRRHALTTGLAAMGAMGLQAPRAAAATADSPPRTLTAQTTEGPYYLDGMPLRADITEGRPGVPLEIRCAVTDALGKPLAGARVDIWQCDAQGLYSGFAGQGENRSVSLEGKTFLRGGLLTDANGEVAFRSIYPGWYADRTTHIHFKVRNGNRAVLTSQFFLPDALNEFLYTRLPDYQRTQVRNVLNSTDGIALRAGDTVVGAVREAADKYVASLAIVVDPQAEPPIHRPGPRSGPPPWAAGGTGGPPPGFGGTPSLKAPEGAERTRALVPKTRSN